MSKEPKKQRPIDLLKAANEKKSLKVEFELPCGDEPIKAFLYAPDQFEIYERQELIKRIAYAKAVEQGLRGVPVSEKEFADDLAKIETDDARAEAVRNRPEDQAEQYARKIAAYKTTLEIIPQFLRTENGELLFPSEEEQMDFVRLMKSDNALLSLITEKYKEMSDLLKTTRDKIKN